MLYFLVAVLATTLGAVTGMGGGVIIKPVLDMLDQYDTASISMLSSITVFAMALISVARRRGGSEKPKAAIAVPLALGAVLGGNIGNHIFTSLLAKTADMQGITIVQNMALAGLIVVVYIYMLFKHKLLSPKLSGIATYIMAGVALGVISSFIGIGGGPFNVALITFLFGFTTKTAILYSLIIILFSQGAKLLSIAVGEGFAQYNLSILPAMLIGAVAGGVIGSAICTRIGAKTTDRLFNATQIMVFCICVSNILRCLG